jgi:hypothetical protein
MSLCKHERVDLTKLDSTILVSYLVVMNLCSTFLRQLTIVAIAQGGAPRRGAARAAVIGGLPSQSKRMGEKQ